MHFHLGWNHLSIWVNHFKWPNMPPLLRWKLLTFKRAQLVPSSIFLPHFCLMLSFLLGHLVHLLFLFKLQLTHVFIFLSLLFGLSFLNLSHIFFMQCLLKLVGTWIVLALIVILFQQRFFKVLGLLFLVLFLGFWLLFLFQVNWSWLLIILRFERMWW